MCFRKESMQTDEGKRKPNQTTAQSQETVISYGEKKRHLLKSLFHLDSFGTNSM